MTNQIKEHWQKQVEQLKKVKLSYHCIQRKCLNSKALYYDLEFKSFDGTMIHAKYIRPAHQEKIPVVFDFHRNHEKSQGWFHLTRYTALNYAVVAMDCRNQERQDLDILKSVNEQIEDMYYHKVYLDALLLSWIVVKLNNIDSESMISFGRDQGAAIALVLAALNPKIKKCSMLYPMLCDIKAHIDRNADKDICYNSQNKQKKAYLNKLDYIDIIYFAPFVKADVLLASALLDTKTPSWTHRNLFEELQCQKTMLEFVKHEHELINAFEDENLKFIL